MASQANYENLHFVLCPFMAQGHLIPMVDIARLLARSGAAVTIVTTPRNASRFERVLDRAARSGLRLGSVQLELPYQDSGLPEGCDNIDNVTSPSLIPKLISAISLLQSPFQEMFQKLVPRPTCLISDACLPWTTDIARAMNVPRISFHGFSCFGILCHDNLRDTKVYEKYLSSMSEYFAVPSLPGDQAIEVTVGQLSKHLTTNHSFCDDIFKADKASYGVIINTFEELELDYVNAYKKERNGKVWCIGPASLSNKEHLDKAQRGNNESIIDENECLKWLDAKKPRSVVYVCLGSLCNLISPQMIELGLGLEASNKPFIWIIRGKSYIDLAELENWIWEVGFEKRIEGRGLVIRGWAPQVLILSHPSIGGFLTHCGWNSSLEGISAGVPLITWPLFAEQFLNEKLVAQVLKIAVTLGVENQMDWGEEEKIGVVVKRETIKSALERLMDEEDQESKERRERAQKLGNMANRAVEEGGSSHNNITLFLEDMIMNVEALLVNN